MHARAFFFLNSQLRRRNSSVRSNHRWSLAAALLLLCAMGARAEKVVITPDSPEGQNIESAANLLEKFGAVDTANRVRARLNNGTYSYDTELSPNAETRTSSEYTNIAARNLRFTDLPALRGKPLDPVKNFDTIFALARTLYHEDVHSGQGYFSGLWGALPGETTDETDAWGKTISAEASWIMNGLTSGTIPVSQLQIMAKDLAGYIGAYQENNFYGLPQAQRQAYLDLENFMQALSNKLTEALVAQQESAAAIGSAPLVQPSPQPQPGGGSSTQIPGKTCKNSDDDCSELGRTAAQKQIEAVMAKDELRQVSSWLSQADALDHDASSYHAQALHATQLAAGYADLKDAANEATYKTEANDYQAKSDAASAQAKALRDKANGAQSKADSLEKAAQDAWNKYYACLALPLCPTSATGTPTGGTTTGGGGGAGVGTGGGAETTNVSFRDCPEAQDALDSAKRWHQQAVKDLELAAQAKLEGNAGRAEGWELNARLDEGNARMWEREAAYRLEQCRRNKTTMAGHTGQPQAPGTNTVGNNPPAPGGGGNAVGGNAGGSSGQPKTGTGINGGGKKTVVPPRFQGGTSTKEPSTIFPGGTLRTDTIPMGPNDTETETEDRNADGSLTVFTRYDANGKLRYTSDLTKSPKLKGGMRYVTKYADGTYTVDDQLSGFDEQTKYDANGKILESSKRTTTDVSSSQPAYSTFERFGPDGKLINGTYIRYTQNADGSTTNTTQYVGADGSAKVDTITTAKDGSRISSTSTNTGSPGLDAFGKGLQQAIEEEERRAEEKKKKEDALEFDPDYLRTHPGTDPPGSNETPNSNGGQPADIAITLYLLSNFRLVDPSIDHGVDFFTAFPMNLPPGMSGAIGNLSGDGRPSIVIGAAPGAAPQVRVFDGNTGNLLNSFYAYEPTFMGGVNVAVGDVNGDGKAEIITGPGLGSGPQVKIFDGKTGLLLNSFLAYDANFLGGVNVAVGDVHGDGKSNIITGPGNGGRPEVKVFDGKTGMQLNTFFAYDPKFTGGVYVAAGDINGDGKSEIVTGPGAGGGPQVKVFNGATGQMLNGFPAYDSRFTGGVRVAVGDANRYGFADILTGAGSGPGSYVKAFNGASGQTMNQFFGLPLLSTANSIPSADTFNPFLNAGAPTGSVGDDGSRQMMMIDSYEGVPAWGPVAELRGNAPGKEKAAATHGKRNTQWVPAEGALLLASYRPESAFAAHRQAAAGSVANPAQATTPADKIEYSIVSSGKTGEGAFQLQVFDPKGMVKKIQVPAGIVLQPLKRSDEKPVATRHAGAKALTQGIGALCLEFGKLPSTAGTLYRIAPAAMQERFKPMRSILEAGHKLADNGQLHPDSDPAAYSTFIRQFALWAKIENWDAQKFADAFISRSRENARVMNVKWTKEMENTLAGAAPGRWRDITSVLSEAEKISKAGQAKAAD